MVNQCIGGLDIPLWARKRALQHLANERLSADIRYQLAQVVCGYAGRCDEDAARAGMEWMRAQYRARGETPRF